LCLALDFEMPTYFMTDVLLVCNFLKQKVFLERSEFHLFYPSSLWAFCHIIANMDIVFSSSQALCTVVWAFGSEYTTQQLSNFPTASRHKTEWYLCLLPLFTPASGDLLLALWYSGHLEKHWRHFRQTRNSRIQLPIHCKLKLFQKGKWSFRDVAVVTICLEQPRPGKYIGNRSFLQNQHYLL